jgi:DNA/RNA-binding protein KIN17
MKLYLENPQKYVKEFSEKFQDQFLETLEELSKGEWITAQEVYKYIVADTNHIHMNATKWANLTEFLEYLEKSGLVNKRVHEKGGFEIKFIDLERDKLIGIEKLEQKRRLDKQQEIENRESDKRMKLVLEAQEAQGSRSGPTQLNRADASAKIQISLGGSRLGQPLKIGTLIRPANQNNNASQSSNSKSENIANKTSPWACVDCIIKIKSGSHDGQKGIVKSVTDDSCRVELIKAPDTVVWVPHTEIETVIPSLNRIVKVVVQGVQRTGEMGILCDVDVEKGTASVMFGADEPEEFKFDHICKVVDS